MFLTSLLAWFNRQIEYRHNIEELSHLSEYELHDIGISHSDIEAIAKGTFDKESKV